MSKKYIVANLIVEINERQNAGLSDMLAMDYIRSSLSLGNSGSLTDLRVMVLGGEAPSLHPAPQEEKRSEVVKKYLYKDYEISITRHKPTQDIPKYIAVCSNTRAKYKMGHLFTGSESRSLKTFQEEIKQHIDKKAIAREKREKKAREKNI